MVDTETDRLKREYERGRKDAKDEFDTAKEIADNILSVAICDAGYGFSKGDGLTMAARAVMLIQHLKRDLDGAESRCHELAKRVVEHIPPVFDGPLGWRCFHCREYFEDPEKAQLHFGASELCKPICQINPEEIRKMEVELAYYRAEDSDLDRKYHAMQADHAVALHREEEKGYDRGLRDGQKKATESPPDGQVSRHHIHPQLQRLQAVPLVAFSNERGRETCLAAARNDFAGEILSALEAVFPTIGRPVRVLVSGFLAEPDKGEWADAHVTGPVTFQVRFDRSNQALELRLHDEGTFWRRDQPSALEKTLFFTVNGRCHAGSDGDCDWPDCPQKRDGEPAKSGRTCPLWVEHHEE